MTIKIATWNINSVRLRIDLVCKFLNEHQPDVLCLQEIKCQNDQFPLKKIKHLGYEYAEVNGQKAYHGVATISKLPIKHSYRIPYCDMGDARHLAITLDTKIGNVILHNFYVPAGGDEPDVVSNPKFAHKLQFLDEMCALNAKDDDGHHILVGDLNVAPHENDVWSHKQLLKIVSHTPIETDKLFKVQQEGKWADLVRAAISEDKKIFSWWSYRAKDWQKSNRGRRLDHIWSSDEVAKRQTKLGILNEWRGMVKPSDHVPIMTELDL